MMSGNRHEFGKWSEADLAKTNSAIASLKTFWDRFAPQFLRPGEFFEPNYKIDSESRKTKDRKLKFLNQTSFLQGLLLKHEIALKLLSIIDGYILSVDHAHALLTYLSARYALELLATINSINERLKTAKAIDLRDWENRGGKFLSELCRGRHAASDPNIASLMKRVGVSASAIKPIRITDAITELAGTKMFPSAIRDYDFLSNICHHNGSAHQLFQQSMQETDRVLSPSGNKLVTVIMPTPSIAVTLEYPSQVACRSSVATTASLVLSCTAWVETVLNEMPIVPFGDDDFATLTDGANRISLNFSPPAPARKTGAAPQTGNAPGRNDACPCRSGKKFKNCCLRHAH
jgi:hypothetical protein